MASSTKLSDDETLAARVTSQSKSALLRTARAARWVKVLNICTGPEFAPGAANTKGAVTGGPHYAPSKLPNATVRFSGLWFWGEDARSIDAEDAAYDTASVTLGFSLLTPAIGIIGAFWQDDCAARLDQNRN